MKTYIKDPAINYKKLLETRNEQIDELCTIIHAFEDGGIASTAPLIAKLIQERNELEEQWFNAQDIITQLRERMGYHRGAR